MTQSLADNVDVMSQRRQNLASTKALRNIDSSEFTIFIKYNYILSKFGLQESPQTFNLHVCLQYCGFAHKYRSKWNYFFAKFYWVMWNEKSSNISYIRKLEKIRVCFSLK